MTCIKNTYEICARLFGDMPGDRSMIYKRVQHEKRIREYEKLTDIFSLPKKIRNAQEYPMRRNVREKA
jgi:hypothetical protein